MTQRIGVIRVLRRNTGFSLTELLVVIAVILVLMGILIVGVQSVYSHAAQVNCQHNLEQIGHACRMYSTSHDGMLPRAWDMHSGRLWYEALASGYLDNWNVLACPSVGVPPSGGGGEGEFNTVARDNVDHLLEGLRWLRNRQETTGAWGSKGATGLALLAFGAAEGRRR